MKTLKLEVTKNRNTKGYHIFIKNGLRLDFDTKTKAETHIRLLKKLLKDTANVLCTIQSDLYKSYRDNFLFFDTRTERKILKSLHTFDNRIHFFYKEFSSGNRSYVFLELENLICFINETIDYLKDHAQKYKAFGLIQKTNSYLKQVFLLRDNLKNELSQISVNLNYRNQRTKVLKLVYRNII